MRITLTHNARTQLNTMTQDNPKMMLHIEKTFERIADGGPFFPKHIANAPGDGGEVVRFPSGRVRVLAIVDGEDMMVFGFGLRPKNS